MQSVESQKFGREIGKVQPVTVVIGAGGSGGHLFPSLAVAEAIKKRAGFKVNIVYMVSGKSLDMNAIEGFEKVVIPMKGISGRGVKGVLQFALRFPLGLLRSLLWMRERKPSLVIGFGGYASVVPVFSGWLLGKKTWIHEAEFKFGAANRFLSLFANHISFSFPFDNSDPRYIYTGHPIRESIIQALDDIRNSHNRSIRNVLVLGGSQGARAIDTSVPRALELCGESVKHLNVTHQCRAENIEMVKERYRRIGIAATVLPFITDMAEAYRKSDLVIARSGAGTVYELAITRKPAILIPLPTSQGMHQLANARFLEKRGLAYVVEEGDNFVERLAEKIEELMATDYTHIVQAFNDEGIVIDAADNMAQKILSEVLHI